MKTLNGWIVRGDTAPVKEGGSSGEGVLTKEAVLQLVNGAIKSFADTSLKGLLDPLMKQVSGLSESLKPILERSGKEEDATPSKAGDGKAADGLSPEANATIKGLQKTVENLRKQQEDGDRRRVEAERKSQEAERNSALTAALAEFKFVDENARNAAFELLTPLITRDEQGNLVSKDNLPVADFIKDHLPSKMGYLLAPESKSGSGAAPGTPRVGGKSIGMETIRPGMSADEEQAVMRQIGVAARDAWGTNQTV